MYIRAFGYDNREKPNNMGIVPLRHRRVCIHTKLDDGTWGRGRILNHYQHYLAYKQVTHMVNYMCYLAISLCE